MNSAAQVFREKRLYNKWVASQTLEDYALRYTADHARKWSVARVVNTAIGASAFLACEAIGASITLTFGFTNSMAAIAAAMTLMFLIGLPIAYRSARHGLDIDLLTRGAGFGYLGSTITSLIYASFTFLLFSVEASIMAVALVALTGMPMSIAYLVSALIVIPIALYGMKRISRFQWATQPVWIVLQMAPILYLLWLGPDTIGPWTQLVGARGDEDGHLNLLQFGFAFSTLLSLLPQIGEQADYLRFLPRKRGKPTRKWMAAVILGGPGWTIIGGVKLALGSILASYAISHGVTDADSPTALFHTIYTAMLGHDRLALILTAIFVITCQMKINVTNAYAGSIAWSNFFSRLTHNHPGRVVWLVFNVLLALLLMEVGFTNTISGVLTLYADLAVGWIGALAADLVISKPLGLSPPGIEFKRAHLYDINPVGVGAMTLSFIASGCAHFALFGPIAQAFAPLLGLAVAFVAAPAIALLTHGRYYIARRSELPAGKASHRCVICENEFQRVDMAMCPLYSAPICSLCCTLEARCYDRCKSDSRATQQASRWLERIVPRRLARHVHTPTGHFVIIFTLVVLANATLLTLIASSYASYPEMERTLVNTVLLTLFLLFTFVGGIATWIVVLAHESRRAAMRETSYHLRKLSEEVAAHEITDAKLQQAKEAAESANDAKSRYLVSVSHEIRSPLNSIYGYAQLLERGGGDVTPVKAAKVIRRSAEHLTNLVEGLLDISQVENGVLRLSNDTVRFTPFLDQIASMFRYQAEAKGLKFLYDRPETLPDFIRTDQKRLRQILINILSNAIKFTRSGSIRFKVHYRSQLATFEISDTGPGIEPNDMERIFAPFERGSNPQAHEQQGVGLGLSITNALIQILGGEIAVKSDVGKGTKFTIRLMLGQVAGQSVDPIPTGTIIGYQGDRRTVAIIDDDPEQRALIRNILEPLGFAVIEAKDGATGVALCEERRPDLALLDITMPGKSGWTVAGEVRAALGDAVRIAMLSADAHEYRKGDAPGDAHDRFLMKPIEITLLLDAIAELLGLHWIVEEAARKKPSKDSKTAEDAPAPLPPGAADHLDAILRLVRMGHVRGIEGAIKAMVEAVPETEPLSVQLLHYLDRFDLRALSDLIQRQKS